MVSAPLNSICVDCGHRRLDHLAAGACDAEVDCACSRFNRGDDVIEGAPVQLARSQILSETLRRVIHRGGDFSDAFYAGLFERQPHLRQRFVRLDDDAQRAKLWAALTAIASAGSAPSSLVAQLGLSHSIGGVEPEDFQPSVTVLLETLERFIGDDLNATMLATWAAVLAEVAEAMIAAAPGDTSAWGLVPTTWIEASAEKGR